MHPYLPLLHVVIRMKNCGRLFYDSFVNGIPQKVSNFVGSSKWKLPHILSLPYEVINLYCERHGNCSSLVLCIRYLVIKQINDVQWGPKEYLVIKLINKVGWRPKEYLK